MCEKEVSESHVQKGAQHQDNLAVNARSVPVRCIVAGRCHG